MTSFRADGFNVILAPPESATSMALPPGDPLRVQSDFPNSSDRRFRLASRDGGALIPRA